MSKKDNNPNPSSVTNTTAIGSVTGQVHTGSGDIYVRNFTSSTIINSKEEFISALHALRTELEVAQQLGLPEDSAKQVTIEVDNAEHEATKDNPKAESIVGRLEKAKAILVAGTGVATATTAAITAVNKILPLIDTVIKYVGKIFQ